MSDVRASSHKRSVQKTLLPSAEQVQSLQSRLNCSPGLQRKPWSDSGAWSVSVLHRLRVQVANWPLSVHLHTLQPRSNTLPGTHCIESCSDISRLLLTPVKALAWLLLRALQSCRVHEKSCPLLSQRHLLQSIRNSWPGLQALGGSVVSDRTFLDNVAFFWSSGSSSQALLVQA